MNIGKYYENKAVEYLISQQYEILYKNYRYKKIEIDIIAKKDEEIIICEVKYRGNINFLTISDKQKKNIDDFISIFYSDDNVRFDLIIFTKDQFEHIQNAYL